jgi:hypothetical protein
VALISVVEVIAVTLASPISIKASFAMVVSVTAMMPEYKKPDVVSTTSGSPFQPN